MEKQSKQPQPVSNTIQSKTRSARQAGIQKVLQKYAVAQRVEMPEEDELLQGKFETAQREELDDEEPVQGKFETVQREGFRGGMLEDMDKSIQRKRDVLQFFPVYRGGGHTYYNYTPRPDTDTEGNKRGLSTYRNPAHIAGKKQVIETGNLGANLQAVENGNGDDDSHVSIRPGDDALLVAWADTKNNANATPHQYSQDVYGARTGVVQGKFSSGAQYNKTDKVLLEDKKLNKTGLPDNLKSGIESLSGYNMDSVRVHFNSPQPAQLQALAYTQGTDIHVAPGQEQHLSHEAWHVVQQMQGRVQPTMQLRGVNVNDNDGLEREADVMGSRAGRAVPNELTTIRKVNMGHGVIQQKRYTVERNIKLEKADKTFDTKEGQTGKTRAGGDMVGTLKLTFPKDYREYLESVYKGEKTVTNMTDDVVRYKNEREKIDKIASKLPETGSATITRPAIYQGAKEGERAKTSQADKIKTISKSNDWIGAHLIKREWGGSDNMWNVVVWPQKAEDVWADGFEARIDLAGALNEDPGNIEIKVEKEDEFISQEKLFEMMQEKKVTDQEGNNPNFIFAVNRKRWEINRAIENVPTTAYGKNDFNPAVVLNDTVTGYKDITEKQEIAMTDHVDSTKENLVDISENNEQSLIALRQKLQKQLDEDQVEETPVKKKPAKKKKMTQEDVERILAAKELPANWRIADVKEEEIRKKERQQDWRKEKDTYDKDAGKGMFEFTNTLFPEDETN